MFTLIDHHTRTHCQITSLQEAYAALAALREGTVCDEDGVLCATMRGGVFTRCNEHGFPSRTAHAA